MQNEKKKTSPVQWSSSIQVKDNRSCVLKQCDSSNTFSKLYDIFINGFSTTSPIL